MALKRIALWRSWIPLLAGALLLLTAALPTRAAPWSPRRPSFATPAFRAVWNASDLAVATGQVARSYTWGPFPWWDYHEFYLQAPRGLRLVQYFDKARMEVAAGTPSGVTNGLLVVELVSGRVKLGDGIGEDQNAQRQPAAVPVAGDPAAQNPDAPTYAAFRGVTTADNGYRDPDRVGQRVGTTLDRAGNRTTNPALAQDPGTQLVSYNTITGHNVPRIFRDSLARAPVDSLFAFGYPIADPYWVRARVAGVERDVFVQLYERRVLTYTPANPPAFRVEMGNVGQHYFQWRYPELGQPWQPDAAGDAALPLAYASQRDGHWEVFTSSPGGGDQRQITAGVQETVPYSWRRTYSGGSAPRLLVDSRRINSARMLFSISLADNADVRQHTRSDFAYWSFSNGAVSPDGTLIALVAEHNDPQFNDHYATLAIQPFGQAPGFPESAFTEHQACAYQSPAWLPDGSGLVFAASCGGKLVISRADLQYSGGDGTSYLSVQLVNVRPIAATPGAENYFPRVSPDGSAVVFASNRDGLGDLYLIDVDGANERRLTADPADDGAATWAPDGTALVFDSNRDGDYELYRLPLANPAQVTRLTDNAVDDRWPIWAQ